MDHIATLNPTQSPAEAHAGYIRGWLARTLARKGIGRLSDAHLKDIGLIRNDVDLATRFGSSRDAADQLAHSALGRSGNW